MLKLYFIRHGKTIFNTLECVQGWNDSPLTELGINQAKCTGYGLRNTIFEKAYTGDCLRQINTVKQISEQNNTPFPIIEDMHFREMCYGKHQGKSYFEMLNPLYERYHAPYEGYFGLYKFMDDYEIAQGVCELDETGETEGPERLWIRFKEGLDMIIASNYEGNILISTSSCAISVMIKKLFPDFKQDGLVDNASITILSYDGHKYKMSDYNDIFFRKQGEEHFSSQNNI